MCIWVPCLVKRVLNQRSPHLHHHSHSVGCLSAGAKRWCSRERLRHFQEHRVFDLGAQRLTVSCHGLSAHRAASTCRTVPACALGLWGPGTRVRGNWACCGYVCHRAPWHVPGSEHSRLMSLGLEALDNCRRTGAVRVPTCQTTPDVQGSNLCLGQSPWVCCLGERVMDSVTAI